VISCPIRFTSGKISPGVHWIGNCVNPSAGLSAVKKRKTLLQLVARRYTD
jgi:hypothetical protein